MSQAGWMAMQGFGRVSDRVAQLGEQRKAEAQKAGALRKYLSVVDPNNKDTYTTAGLPDLEGAMMAHAQQRQQEQDELRQAEMRQMMTARALQIQQEQNKMAQQAGFENLLRQATAGPLAQDATPQTLLRAATQYPGAQVNPVLMQAMQAGEAQMPFTPEDVVDLGELTGNPMLKGRIVTRQTPKTWTQPINVAGDQQLDTWLKQEEKRYENSVKKMDRQALLNRQRDIKKQLSDGLSGMYLPESKRLELETELKAVENGLGGKKEARAVEEVMAEYEWRDGKLVPRK